MKRVVKVLLLIVLVFLIVSYFIPVNREKQVFVRSTFENVISSTTLPENWIKWDAEVGAAWQKDSSACKFGTDTTNHIISINIPGKKIRITQLTYLLYQLEEIKNNHSSVFSFTIIPYVGNGQPRSQHNSTIVYAEKTSLLFRILPFLEKGSSADRTISELQSYLEDNTRFYGFPIELKQATDTLFLTHKASILKQDLFKKLPTLFDDLDRFARENQCQPVNRNIAYDPTNNDSLSILAGINIDKIIMGDYLHNFMELPTGQFLAVGQFEGPFRDRSVLYKAIEKYLSDHQFIRIAVPYEKYLSPLPATDSSIVKITLSYPLRN